MATFSVKPTEGQDPWGATDLAWRASVESAVNASEVTIDKSAGIKVSVQDNAAGRKQLIYGDTGERALPIPAIEGLSAVSIAVSRQAYMVTLSVDGLMCNAGSIIATLPVGFRPKSPRRFSVTPTTNASNSVLVQTNGEVTISQAFVSAAQGYWEISFKTSQAWPTVLPGTASGSIPNT